MQQDSNSSLVFRETCRNIQHSDCFIRKRLFTRLDIFYLGNFSFQFRFFECCFVLKGLASSTQRVEALCYMNRPNTKERYRVIPLTGATSV